MTERLGRGSAIRLIAGRGVPCLASQEELAHRRLGEVVGAGRPPKPSESPQPTPQGARPIAVATRYIVWYTTPTCFKITE